MSNNTKTDKRATYQTPVRRREALKGLGALAVTAPCLAALGCASDSTGSMGNPGVGAGTGATGAPPSPPAGAAGSATGRSGAAGGMSTSTGAGGTASPGRMGTGGATPSSAGPTKAGSGAAGRSAEGATAGSSSAATGGRGPAAAGSGGGGVATAGGAAPGAGDFIPVKFDDAMSCMLTPTDPAGEGPFFLHEDEVMDDEHLIRSDMREGKPGVELQLNLRVLDSDGKCMKGISGVEVYTWHTDASGFYSGFANQNPDKTYTGGIERTVENMDRFCRGIQVTDAEGIVRFKTVYPGWYNGRAIHIHFVALRPGSTADTANYRSSKYMVFTTQMYFAEQFSRMIHENNDPYKARTSAAGYSMYVKPQNTTVNPTMRMEGKIAVGALNIITAASGSRR